MPEILQPITKHLPFYPGQWGISGSDSALGIRTVPMGRVFYVHSENVNANINNDGTDPNFPLTTVAAAYAKTVSGQNDVVAVIGQATAYPVTTPLLWTNHYTHLVGVSADLPGVGQRTRINSSAALDLANVITIQGNGCVFENVQFANDNDAAAPSGAAIVTGSRCYFKNVFFAGILSQLPANDVGSYSLTINGSENVFERCSIGVTTMIRTAANYECIISGNAQHNKFIDTEFLSWSVTAGKALVTLTAGSTSYNTQFTNCLFHNMNMAANGAGGAAINNAIVDAQAAFHQIVFHGQNTVVGCTGVADVLTFIWSAGPAPVNTFGIALNPVA